MYEATSSRWEEGEQGGATVVLSLHDRNEGPFRYLAVVGIRISYKEYRVI